MTQLKSFTPEGVQFAWDGTSLETAGACLRKYYYSMIRRIAPKNKSVHLIFGGIYASALELFYKLRADGAAYEEALHSVVRYTLEASWDKEEGKPIPFEDDRKTRITLVRTVIWYLEQYGHEDPSGYTTYHLTSGKPAVELSFTVELDDEILYCGHLDRVMELDQHKFIFDQKTTGSSLSTWYGEQFSPNNQMSGYAFAGEMLLQTPIKGVIIDAAQIAINFTNFERFPTTRTKDQITEWRQSSIWTIKNAQRATEEGFFPMNPAACGNYGGCPFRSLCRIDPKVREHYIKSDFVDKIWDPLQER